EQGDQSHLAINVERRKSEKRERQSRGKGQRHGARENDEGIAEALKLRRQDQIDQNSREQKCPEKFAALNPELARLAGVVHSEALGQGCLGLVFQVCQRLIKWHRRRNHALNTHSIELLELVQRARLGRRLQAGKSRERHELVV